METIKSKDGRIYQIDDRGTRRRISPIKPWRGKSERRLVIKARRQSREAK